MVPKQAAAESCLPNEQAKVQVFFHFQTLRWNTLEHLAINQMKDMNTQTAFNHVYCHKWKLGSKYI